MKWYEINLSEQQIITFSIKSALIKMPNKSKYKDFKFWFPMKLLKNKANHLVITFNDSFVFKIFKTSSITSFKPTKTDEINAEDILEAFDVSSNNLNIKNICDDL